MIQLTGINRNAIHLAPAAIASVTEAGVQQPMARHLRNRPYV